MRLRLFHREDRAPTEPRRLVDAFPAPAQTEADVDLDRVVWDPEYREEIRGVLRATA